MWVIIWLYATGKSKQTLAKVFFASVSASRTCALVPDFEPCLLCYATGCQVHWWSDTDNMDVVSFLVGHHKYKNIHAQHTQGPIDCYKHINTY